MQESWSYIKDSGGFINKMSQIDDIPEDAVLVTAEALGLYPSASHEAALKALKNALKKEKRKAYFYCKINQYGKSKITFSDLMVLLNNKFQERPLVQSVLS